MSSCTRYNTKTTHTRDTIWIEKADTTQGFFEDTTASDSSETVVETVFMEIEKDCPNAKEKLPEYKKEIKQAETMESKTGGSISAHSDSLNFGVIIKFKGDEISGVYWKGRMMVVEDKTVIDKKRDQSDFSKALSLWPWLLIGAIIFFIIGRFVKFFS